MKKYKTGMYGGKFLPFHKGHRFCVETAAHECDTVYVILFYGGVEEDEILRTQPEDWLSVENRIAQMNKICSDASHIARVIPCTIDISTLRNPDGSEDWEAETPLVRNIVGMQLDAVYSSEESYGDYFSRAYPEAEHRLVDIHRIHYPISGTAIRAMSDNRKRTEWII